MTPGPPQILRRILTWVLPRGPVRDGLLGDLDELYVERAQRGRASANTSLLCIGVIVCPRNPQHPTRICGCTITVKQIR